PGRRPCAGRGPGADPRDRLARALRMDAFPARLAEDPRGFPAGVSPGITGLIPGPEA
ncbi:spermidine synthase, partial [Micrococcus sp. R8502A1]